VVWAALHSRTDILFDGLPAEAWPEGGEEQAPLHLHVAWPFTDSLGGPTDVSLTLHDAGGGVRVDVRHAGWGEGPAWDTAIQGHFAGWLQGLAALGLLVESGVDARDAQPMTRPRYFVSGELQSSPSAVYRSLVDASVRARWSNGAFEGVELVEGIEDRFIRWRRPAASGPPIEITAILRATPRGTHLAVAEYGVVDEAASGRWPSVFEGLARFLS
jgi:hypothetical protein